MKERLVGVGVPAVVVGAALGGGLVGTESGWIPPAVWQYLWPSLVAILFLFLGLAALWFRGYRWLWPCGAGFLVQTVCTLLIVSRTLKPFETILYTSVVVLIVLFVMLVAWLTALVRARFLEQKMIDGLSSAASADQQEVAKIRKSMAEALALLKRAGGGRNAIYKLPWFLVIGRSQAGKTVAIKNSGMTLPVKKDWVKGVGGTHTCDFFFTNDLIFLDTPGDWVTKAADENQQKEWIELVRLLRKYRGRRPLDGIVVLVPADDLLTRSEQDLQEQGSNARVVIDLLQAELRFRFPIYLLVSKTDLIDGFSDFFRGVPARRKNEIVGYSYEDSNSPDPMRGLSQGFRRVLQRLQAYRLEMLARIAARSQARRLFFFTDEFKNLERPLMAFASMLLAEGVEGERPVFRGFYFTSGTQGEGTPLGQAMSGLARTLGVRMPQPPAGEEEVKRGHFLLDLFRRLMVEDQGLVGRTAIHWWRRRRGTMLGTFLPAALAGFWLLMSLVTFAIYNDRYHTIKEEMPGLVGEIHQLQRDRQFSGAMIRDALVQTEQMVGFHQNLAGFSPASWFLMRRPGDLTEQVLTVFSEQFRNVIVAPTFHQTMQIVTDDDESCTNRIDALYSVVWLRSGHGAEWASDTRALDRVWDLDEEDAAEARGAFLEQYTYLMDHAPRGDGYLLPGFDLGRVAESLDKSSCARPDALSTIEKYSKFLEECSAPDKQNATRCWNSLKGVVRMAGEDSKRLGRQLEGLRKDLRRLEHDEAHVDEVLRVVNQFRGVNRGGGETCVGGFDRNVVPAIQKFCERQKPLVDECKAEWISKDRRRAAALRKIDEQEKALADKEGRALSESLAEFGQLCDQRLRDVTALPVIKSAREFRKLACQGLDKLPASTTTAARGNNAGHSGGGSDRETGTGGVPPKGGDNPGVGGGGRARANRGYDFIEAASSLPGPYTYQAWSDKKAAWQEEAADAQSLGGDGGSDLKASLRNDIGDYSDRYYKEWKRYLGGLHFKEMKTSAPAWLLGLSGTQEIRRALLAGGQTSPAGESGGDPLLEPFAAGTTGLKPLAGFAAAPLAAYQQLLAQISTDLEKCSADKGFWAQYRTQIHAGAADNNVVKARELVRRDAGPIAEGVVVPLLTSPLDRATEYLESPDLITQQWTSLLSLYKGVAGDSPFAEQSVGLPLVERSELVALLGGRSGLAPVLGEAGKGVGLSARALEWITSASSLSAVFFDKGSDEPKKLNLKLTLDRALTITPEKDAKEYEVREIQFIFGMDVKPKWAITGEPGPDALKCPVAMFGDEAPPSAMLSVKVAERKGLLGRSLTKKNYNEPAFRSLKAEGPWYVISLLSNGAPENLTGSPNVVGLTYEVPLVDGEKEPPKLTIHVRAEAEGLVQLLRLYRAGFPPPPTSPTGE